MRHARAITMMQKGADRNEIQASLGHRSPKIARLLKVLASPDLKALQTHYHYHYSKKLISDGKMVKEMVLAK